MASTVFLEYDAGEARVLIASGRGGGLNLEEAFAIPFLPDENGAVNRADVIVKALQNRNLKNRELSIALCRSDVELRFLRLPPSPESELPILVRMQATREFNDLNDNWLLDYIPLSGSETEPRTVLAAAVSPAVVSEAQKISEGLEWKLNRLMLRSTGIASFLNERGLLVPEDLSLALDFIGSELELTVLQNGQPIFPRSTRFSGEAVASVMLRGEIMRTFAAALNQVEGTFNRSLILLGKPAALEAVSAQLKKDLEMPVNIVDPLGEFSSSRGIAADIQKNAGRYAALVGLAKEELSGKAAALDFLHPHRKEEPRKKWRSFVLPAALLVVLFFGYLFYQSRQRQELEDQIAGLQAEITREKELLKLTSKYETDLNELEKWTADNILWIDELAFLSTNLPPAKEVILHSLALGPRRIGEVEGGAVSAAKLEELGKKLEDANHHFVNKGSSEDGKAPYLWRFKATMQFSPEKKP